MHVYSVSIFEEYLSTARKIFFPIALWHVLMCTCHKATLMSCLAMPIRTSPHKNKETHLAIGGLWASPQKQIKTYSLRSNLRQLAMIALHVLL